MPITQAFNSKGNIKKPTENDLPFSPLLPVIASYYAVSTDGQTTIPNLGFQIDQANTDVFWLFVDGQKLRLGASNDYVFYGVDALNFSASVQFNAPLLAGLNIQAYKLGLKPDNLPVSGFLGVRWVLEGITTPGFIDINGPHYVTKDATITKAYISMLNSGTSGSTTIQINQYRSGSLFNSVTGSLPSASGNPSGIYASLSASLALTIGDILTCDTTTIAGGAPESLAVEI